MFNSIKLLLLFPFFLILISGTSYAADPETNTETALESIVEETTTENKQTDKEEDEENVSPVEAEDPEEEEEPDCD